MLVLVVAALAVLTVGGLARSLRTKPSFAERLAAPLVADVENAPVRSEAVLEYPSPAVVAAGVVTFEAVADPHVSEPELSGYRNDSAPCFSTYTG